MRIKHTPGPWQIISGDAMMDEIVDPWLRSVCFVKTNRQDAVLLAAAPKLLEALKHIHEECLNEFEEYEEAVVERVHVIASTAISEVMAQQMEAGEQG